MLTADVADAAGGAATTHGDTPHFIVAFDPALGADGQTIADAILATCEADYATLGGYFGGIVPPGLPFRVTITTDDFGAVHLGCDGVELFIGARTIDHVDTAFMRRLVLAEEDEVFEASFGHGWDCGSSNGEGLSRVLASSIVPGLDPPDFVSANSWLNSDRPDYVSTNDPTDRNYVSIGCSVLFLNWLHTQLGFTWDQIIAAGAPTLSGTYTNLTRATDGFKRFNETMLARFPEDQQANLESDNPFPL
jgi:hypothetical protein